MTDEELIKIITEFAKGVIGGGPSKSKCFMVCAPLQTYLEHAFNIKAKMVQGEIKTRTVVYGHYWLELPDGRILDPTADQFNEAKGKSIPMVYLGKKPRWYNMTIKF